MATIQWYPGHMEKAKRQIQSALPAVDLVIELRDARVPISSRNPMLNDLIKDKLRLLVLTKADIADPQATTRWLTLFQEQQLPALAIDSFASRDRKRLLAAITQVTAPLTEQWQAKGIARDVVRLLVLGIPNVGKSTFINQLSGKKIASVGNRPGVTKGQQWIKINQRFELLDTPGILWPKFSDPRVGERLALTGAIKKDHYYSDDIALAALPFLRQQAKAALTDRYRLTEADWTLSDVDLLLRITKQLGFRDDYERGAERLIMDIQKGKLGRLTFDDPSECADVLESDIADDRN